MNAIPRWLRWTALVVVLVVLAGAVFLWATTPRDTHFSVTLGSAPTVGSTPMRGPAISQPVFHVKLLSVKVSPRVRVAGVESFGDATRACNAAPKACPKYLNSNTPTATVGRTRSAAVNYKATYHVWVSNENIADILGATVVFHITVVDNHITDSWYTYSHNQSWLWVFQGRTVEANHTGWCNACMGDYHYWRLRFEWKRTLHLVVVDLTWSTTEWVAMTMRAQTYPYGRITYDSSAQQEAHSV